MSEKYDFTVPFVGFPKIQSPIKMSNTFGDSIANYVKDDELIMYDIDVDKDNLRRELNIEELMQRAGPREKIYFHPGHVHAGIVTCGGLCPGLNDVIRSIVRTLWYRYGVRRITGIRNGYKGLLAEYNIPIMELNPDVVEDIHHTGGTILGSSRGGSNTEDIADSIERLNLNMLFTIGGDGTQRGALRLAEELESRKLKIAIVGVPKTIDNDLSFIQKSFGFETAVSKAVEAVDSAHIEAGSAINGIGLVKVMGRESGFIAAHTALALNVVNFVLIPEILFELNGANGLLKHLKKRILARGHAVILVAEGAGQNLFKDDGKKDESGNKKLQNIGIFLKERIVKYFRGEKIEINLKYIDPSYIIRSSPPHANDSIYCARLGDHAVHAAMAGKTKVLISLVHDTFVHLPMNMAVSKRNSVNPESSLWRDVLSITRQPIVMGGKK